MNSRTYYYNKLSDALKSNVWSQLKNTMIGRELLSWGSELLYQNATIMHSVIDCLNWETCPDEFIPWAASMNDCELAYFKPFIVSCKYCKPVDDLVPPFALSFSFSGHYFTNIDVVDANTQFDLYEGAAKQYGSMLIDFGISDSVVADDENVLDDNITRYWQFDSKLYPASVRVFIKRDSKIIPLQKWSKKVDKSEPYFKVVADRDLKQRVVVYNVPGLSISDVQIVWLDLINATTSLELPEKTKISRFFGGAAGQGVDIDVDICGFIAGEAFSYALLRRQIEGQVSGNKGISLYHDLVRFVNQFVGVQDSNPVATGLNEITVFIKPKQQVDLDGVSSKAQVNLLNLVAELRHNGEFLVDYKAKLGREIKFDVMISMLDNEITNSLKSTIETALTAKSSSLNYEVLKFRDVPSIQMLADLISVYTTNIFNVQLAFEEPWNGKFSFTPITSTVKFYKEGKLVAWDEQGEIFSVIKSTKNIHQIGSIGVCWVNNILTDRSVVINIGTKKITKFEGGLGDTIGNFRVFPTVATVDDGVQLQIISREAFEGDQNLSNSKADWASVKYNSEELRDQDWCFDGSAFYGINKASDTQNTDNGYYAEDQFSEIGYQGFVDDNGLSWYLVPDIKLERIEGTVYQAKSDGKHIITAVAVDGSNGSCRVFEALQNMTVQDSLYSDNAESITEFTKVWGAVSDNQYKITASNANTLQESDLWDNVTQTEVGSPDARYEALTFSSAGVHVSTFQVDDDGKLLEKRTKSTYADFISFLDDYIITDDGYSSVYKFVIKGFHYERTKRLSGFITGVINCSGNEYVDSLFQEMKNTGVKFTEGYIYNFKRNGVLGGIAKVKVSWNEISKSSKSGCNLYKYVVLDGVIQRVRNWSFNLINQEGYRIFIADKSDLCFFSKNRWFVCKNYQVNPQIMEITPLQLSTNCKLFYLKDAVAHVDEDTGEITLLAEFYRNEYNAGFYIVNKSSFTAKVKNAKIKGAWDKGLWIIGTDSGKYIIYKLNLFEDTYEVISGDDWYETVSLGKLSLDDSAVTNQIEADYVTYASVGLKNLSEDSYLSFRKVIWS